MATVSRTLKVAATYVFVVALRFFCNIEQGDDLLGRDGWVFGAERICL